VCISQEIYGRLVSIDYAPGRLTMQELRDDRWNPLEDIVAAFAEEEAIYNDDNNDSLIAMIGSDD
jgi:hypothetical protein